VILPIGDTPNPRGFVAWVTWLLIAINVAVYLFLTLPLSFTPADPSDPGWTELAARVAEDLPPRVDPRPFLATLTAWDLVVEQHGFQPGRPSIADLVSAMFMHAGFAHVAGNLLFLWIYGDNVEHRLGRLGYLGLYLGAGVLATAVFAVVAPDPMTPLVGASGAISGVLGAYALLFPHNKVKLFVVLFPFLMDTFLVPAPLVLGIFVLVDNLLPFLVGESAGGVAYGAHLGGFVGGFVVAWLVRRSGVGQRSEEQARRRLSASDPEERALAHLEVAEAELRESPAEAFQHLVAAMRLTRDPAKQLRARRALAELPLDPGLRRRLGL
jgi:membrane associated rhomboid family serine protease